MSLTFFRRVLGGIIIEKYHAGFFLLTFHHFAPHSFLDHWIQKRWAPLLLWGRQRKNTEGFPVIVLDASQI
jgi:hypothetical protein